MPIRYEETPEQVETIPLKPRTPTTLPATNGTLLPQPDPPALPINDPQAQHFLTVGADPLETIALVVERCLGRGPKDERYKRALALWLAGRHPERAATWWLAQWGLG